MDTKLKIIFTIFIACILSLYLINNNKFLDAVSTMQRTNSQITFLLENNDITEDTELHDYNIKVLSEAPTGNSENTDAQYFEITKDNIHLWAQKTSDEGKAKILKSPPTSYGFENDRTIEHNLTIIAICYLSYLFYLWFWHFKRTVKFFSFLWAGFCFYCLNSIISFFIFPFASAFDMGIISANTLRTINLAICCGIIFTNLQMTNIFLDNANKMKEDSERK